MKKPVTKKTNTNNSNSETDRSNAASYDSQADKSDTVNSNSQDSQNNITTSNSQVEDSNTASSNNKASQGSRAKSNNKTTRTTPSSRTHKTSKKDEPYAEIKKPVTLLFGAQTATTPSEALAPQLNSVVEEKSAGIGSSETLPIAKIQLPASQPRRYFDPTKLEELSRSIQELGILEPILVRPLPNGDYELVAGERRYKAAQIAGLTDVPVAIREMDDVNTYKVQLVENLQREDLNPIEETEGILDLLALQLEWQRDEVTSHLNKMRNACDRHDENSEVRHNVMSQHETKIIEELFATLGRMSWESFVKNRLPLLNLPQDALNALRSGKIEYTKARVIARIKEESDRASILEEAIDNNLSLEEIKRLVKEYQSPNSVPHLKSEYKELTKKLGTSKVWGNPKKQKALEKLMSQIKQLLDSETDMK